MAETSDSLIAIKERINEARAKQRGWAIEEEEAAQWIQRAIREQSELEDKIIGLEHDYAIAKTLL